MATGHAEPQVDPGVAYLEAVFATVGAGCYFFDLIEMSAVHDRFDSLSADYTDFADKTEG